MLRFVQELKTASQAIALALMTIGVGSR